uniref:Origin recognition complex subunit 1 n=1 Tax=Caenorhabditis tropicalis TaxID=1561998 RepID=A0A1I7TMA5_9PELO
MAPIKPDQVSPEKRRRSTRLTQNSIVTKQLEARKLSQKPLLRTKGAPFRQQSESSSSSSDDDEDDEVNEHEMDINEYSDELGDSFSDKDSVVSTHSRTRSGSIGSDKENGRLRTRSQMSSRKIEVETPSKILAKKLSATSIRTPSKTPSKRNLARESGISSTPSKEVKSTPRSAARKTNTARRTAPVFSESEEEEEIEEKKTKRNRSLKVRIPVDMIPKPIPRIYISKTPGGTMRTRAPLEKKFSEEEVFVDPLDSTSASTLRELASRLHLSKVPEQLPCRDFETQQIKKFIREVIDPKRGESSAMYISGVPGTGKTATVRAAVSSMKKDKKCPKFVYVEVNAMMFKKTVFVEVYNGIQEEHTISKKQHKTRIASSTARQELNSMFKKEDKNRPPIVVLIDELDSLCNRKQDILYDIFEWTALPQSKVTIIGIANTLDFPERMLCQRNASRLDKRRLVFQPYQHKQIEEIVRARLRGSNLIEPKAIELVAKKIAMNTGDLRQALDFLCRAIGVAIERKAEKLEVGHVIAAQSAVLEPLKYRLVKDLTLHEFILFRTIVAMTKEQEEVIFADVYRNYCSCCTEVSGIDPASDTVTFGTLLSLSSIALVHTGRNNQGRMNQRVKLGMTSMEADKAVQAFVEVHKTDYSI